MIFPDILVLILIFPSIDSCQPHQCGTGEEGKGALVVEKTDAVRSRRDSYDLPKSFEHEPASPLPPSDLLQMEQVQKLKEHVGSLVQAKVILVNAMKVYLKYLDTNKMNLPFTKV